MIARKSQTNSPKPETETEHPKFALLILLFFRGFDNICSEGSSVYYLSCIEMNMLHLYPCVQR